MSSGKLKSQLRKARAELHKKNNLIGQYKTRVAGDANALVNYVQGLAKFGEFALDALAMYQPDRAGVLYAMLVTWAKNEGMITRIDDKWVVTHLCNKEQANGSTETQA